jgi:hypothetical protein
MSGPTDSHADYDWQTMADRMRERDRRIKEATALNKIALFDALDAGGITSVVLNFDAEGDSGQIEEIVARDEDMVVALPESMIEIVRPLAALSGLERLELSLCQAIETLCYDFLAETHAFWQDNEGSFGEFTFDVAARTIALDFNVRVMRTDYYAYSF